MKNIIDHIEDAEVSPDSVYQEISVRTLKIITEKKRGEKYIKEANNIDYIQTYHISQLLVPYGPVFFAYFKPKTLFLDHF